MKVVSILCWPEMLSYLEEKTEQARRGEIRGLVVVAEYDNGDSGHYTFHMENSQPMTLLGQIALVTHEISQKEIKRARDQ